MARLPPRLLARTAILAALASSLALTPPRASAQEACAETSPCPVQLAEPVFHAITGAGEAHFWTLMIANTGGFRIELTSVAPNYRLYAYGPDRTLVGVTSRAGEADLVIEVQGSQPGRHTIVVDIPEGQPSGAPYQLLAVHLSIAPTSATEEWNSNFGVVTLTLTDATAPVVLADGYWLQPPGTGACPLTPNPCRGIIRDGRYLRATRTLSFSYYEDWVDLTGSATLTLSAAGQAFNGTWVQPGSSGPWDWSRSTPSALVTLR